MTVCVCVIESGWCGSSGEEKIQIPMGRCVRPPSQSSEEWKWRCASSASVRQSAASAAHNSTLIDRAPFPLSLLTHSFAHYYFHCCLNLPAIAVATTATVQMHLSVSTVRQLGISSSRSRSVDQQRGQSTAAKSAKWQLPHKCCQEKLKRSSSSLMCSEKWERRRCAPRKERKRKKKKKITTNFQSPKLLSATAHTSLYFSFGHSLKNGG